MDNDAATTEDLSLKRCRKTYEDQQASVRVVYSSLSIGSRKKLEELLRQWTVWHAQNCNSSEDSSELLGSGEETYFPALHVGPEKSCTITYSIDNQVNKKQAKENNSLDSDSAPLYDREFSLADESTDKERDLALLNASRCFNCGSYNHSLKECQKPRDNVAVNSARKEHLSKKKGASGPRVLTRYYQKTPGGKFDGLTPGCLDSETRKVLGIGKLDPPPWLNRMRELGYPPGYFELEEDDQPSGITVHVDGESNIENDEVFKLDLSETKKKKSVDFPGINAPIPKNANKGMWACPPKIKSSEWSNNHLNYSSNFSPEVNYQSNPYHKKKQAGYSPNYLSDIHDRLQPSSPLPDYFPNHLNSNHIRLQTHSPISAYSPNYLTSSFGNLSRSPYALSSSFFPSL